MPGGKETTQEEILQELAKQYDIKVITSSLTHAETRMYFDSCYFKSLGYILGQSFFVVKELQAIKQEAIQ
eukprot:12397240-Ditylum_brightwellii.AAC.1